MQTSESLSAAIESLPQHLQDLLAASPPNVDRRTGAELVSRHLFPISHRSLEAWPLPCRFVNGKVIFPTAALIAMAHSKLSAAPVVMGGRRPVTRSAEQQAAPS